MPVYEYLCADCGAFEGMRPMSESAMPAACPECGCDAPRAVLTAAATSLMDAGTRRAYATNERSRHAPKLASQQHGRGCSCCAPKSSTNGVTTDGKAAPKSFPKARPWMISH
jgi:putative FmdB family regulatory protein